MKVVSTIFECKDDAELVSQFTQIMMDCCNDYPESKAHCESVLDEMKRQIGEEVVDELVSALTRQIASDIRFAAAQGFKSNLEYFRNPAVNRFLQADFEHFMREDVMIRMPYRKEAEAVETRITESFDEEMKKLYEVVREHHIYHETVCPKLAHYLAFCAADYYLPAVEPGYVCDIVMTMAYQRLMGRYLGCEIVLERTA